MIPPDPFQNRPGAVGARQSVQVAPGSATTMDAFVTTSRDASGRLKLALNWASDPDKGVTVRLRRTKGAQFVHRGLDFSFKDRFRGVACFAMYRLICHSNPWEMIDVRGDRNGHLNDRFFNIASNWEISIIDHSRHATGPFVGE